MSSPLSADVVNAFLAPAIEVLCSCIQTEVALEKVELTAAMPAKSVEVTIELSGHLVGRVHWSFEGPVARRVADAMLPGEPVERRSLEVTDAVAELANIICGNASGQLLSAGYQVELATPNTRVHSGSGEVPLDPKLPGLILKSPWGRVRMLFAVVARGQAPN